MAAWLMWMTERGLYQPVSGADPARLEDLLTSITDIYRGSLYQGLR